MRNRIDIQEDVRSYKTQTGLCRGIEKFGLDNIDGLKYVVCKTESGRWTAIFMITNYLNKHGGYAGLASQHGFMSV